MYREIERLDRSDRAPAGAALTDMARDFHKTEAPSLQNHQSFDFRVLQGERAREHIQSFAIDPHKSRRRIADGPSEDGPQNGPEKRDTQGAAPSALYQKLSRVCGAEEARADDHFAIFVLERRQERGDVSGIV